MLKQNFRVLHSTGQKNSFAFETTQRQKISVKFVKKYIPLKLSMHFFSSKNYSKKNKIKNIPNQFSKGWKNIR